MPRAMKSCASCTNKVRAKTYCDECAKSRQFKGTNKDTRYSSAQWKNLRLVILIRDKYRCYLCGDYGADSVDHIVSVARGGDFYAENNLAAAHMKPCQYRKMNQADKTG